MKLTPQARELEADAKARAKALGHDLTSFSRQIINEYTLHANCRHCSLHVSYFLDERFPVGDKRQLHTWNWSSEQWYKCPKVK
jgi:hypothetical protein